MQAVPQELLPNLLGERSGAVPVPQTKENVVKRTQLAPHFRERGGESLDQPGDQARRDSADAEKIYENNQATKHVEILQTQYIDKVAAVPLVIQRQVTRTQTFPKTVNVPPANECNSAPSSIVSPNRLSTCQRLRSWKRSSRRLRSHMNECISDPSSMWPQSKKVPQERIPEGIGVQIDDDTVPVDQPGDRVRRDPQACGVATTGPSTSNCGEDVGSLARAVRQ